MLYVGACIAFLDATSFTMIRCMITKHVKPDEVGKLLSVVGAFQAFIPLISSPIFGVIYRSTVASLPQTYLIVLACFFALDWLLLFFINRGVRKIAKKEEAAYGKELAALVAERTAAGANGEAARAEEEDLVLKEKMLGSKNN